MSDAVHRIRLSCKRDAKTARVHAEDVLRSDPLALAQAARRLSVSGSTTRATSVGKRLPCVRLLGRKGLRGRLLVRPADVDALLRDPPVHCATCPPMRAYTDETGRCCSHLMQRGTLARARAEEKTFLPVRKRSKKSKGGCHD